jgi:hypothetical protein
MDELELLAKADERARMYTTAIGKPRAFPDGDALANLALFDEQLPEHGVAAGTVALTRERSPRGWRVYDGSHV